MKKIAVVTGTRAEYGLLKPLISAIEKDLSFELKLIVTGMHLMPEFGSTFKEIEADGFRIDYKIKDDLDGDTSKAITISMGKAMIGFAEVYEELRPDLLIVLGDRSEILVAVVAAVIATIPVAHIHGGETTEGAYDEFIRHAITKMSHLHFATTEKYRARIIQLGEDPSRVFNVGAIGIDSIKTLKLLSREEFEHSISKKLDKKSVLITFHPVTLENATAKKQFQELLKALETLDEVTLIFTKPNSDKDGRAIIELIDDYVSKNVKKAVEFPSLGQLRYLSALQFVDFVIGNSSSGILEVPYFNIPTINIGNRQKGRITTKSVLNCEPNFDSIKSAITKAMDEEFLKSLKDQEQIYGDGTATNQIMSVLKSAKLTSTQKAFYDLKSIEPVL